MPKALPISSRQPPALPGGVMTRAQFRGETLSGRAVAVSDATIRQLEAICPTRVDDHSLFDYARDWWPLGLVWSTSGHVARLPSAVVMPSTVDQIAAVLRICNEARIPVVAAGGRSGVLGNSLPVFGGVVLDTTQLSGILDLREDDLVVDVQAGTFGDDFETTMQAAGYTAGHWPQSIALSTVGGWIACRGAGQMSSRYGTISDITMSVTAVLADGSVIDTSDYSHSATGPDLTQLFVGSEGTLGVITSARLRISPKSDHARNAAFAFPSFAAGVAAIRRFVRRGMSPAIVRLYDQVESRRNFGTTNQCVLILRDEGDPALIDGPWQAVLESCDGEALGDALVKQWMSHRNNVSTMGELIADRAPDTMEVAAPWSRVVEIYEKTTAAISAIDGSRTATAHISHVYSDRVGLYFMFGGRPELNARPGWYRQVWDAAATTVLQNGGNLSHHHGIGLGRGRFMRSALGSSFDVLDRVKSALDPNRILNPGKMGLDSPFGPPPVWSDDVTVPPKTEAP
ncbi:FAD-binding oxidoreductase [Rhodopseudomonas pseudopalustris]|uniref:Alkyldihydroxyacetonephosphate synthase n=2 Tax=Rhodopseudomonas pseudopalustris TaxID=1513892 RepID=A0A1H8NCV9_9BRAD|nr:FAD-binding oxidoreductase [Rhodopseudomonas pseudopalustris]SEO27392.1 alkyldihydroxyacetonephosphate synthase [Rhodopseudomonas pseudopalustris]